MCREKNEKAAALFIANMDSEYREYLCRLAKKNNQNSNLFLGNLIEQAIHDTYDAEIADMLRAERIKNNEPTYTLEEVAEELGCALT